MDAGEGENVITRLSATAALLLAGAAALLPATPALAQAPGEASAVPDRSCDRACLIDALRDHMKALATRDPSALPLSRGVIFTENNVPIKMGEGLWRTVTAVDETGLEAADPTTGNAAWFGSVREHGVPAFYAVRIHMKDGIIDEIESVVHRKTSLPAPYGNAENMVHDEEFNQILPPEQRRSRERMLAIADAYFDTVEVNDGQVFAPFSQDCGRLENGISTTAPAPAAGGVTGGGGNAASIATGCREQFLLGIYRINKRVRRDFFIVDEERGVAVGRGFFDHANEWDRYKLTDGREMRTALKWPNSITLLEAFRIRNAEISRIETVFTYVPYFMHNPFWGPHSPSPEPRPDATACDTACVTGHTNAVMAAYPVRGAWEKLPWANRVGYAENSVGIRVNEGIWQGVTAVDSKPLVVGDAETGNGVWIGRIEEHGQPAWAAITVRSAGRQIDGIDALIRRKEYGPPYAEPQGAPQFATLPQARRTSRNDMKVGVAGFYAGLTGRAPASAALTDGCQWTVNGQVLGRCTASAPGEGVAGIGTIRDSGLLAVDETRGLAVFRRFEDRPATASGYPLTLQVVDVFRFDGGKIAAIESFTSELPVGMRPH